MRLKGETLIIKLGQQDKPGLSETNRDVWLHDLQATLTELGFYTKVNQMSLQNFIQRSGSIPLNFINLTLAEV